MPRSRRALRPDEPNVTVPLAVSYNERGVAGYTHAVTNGEDQRKVNCMYEPVKNPMTGKGTLTLVKRPGIPQAGSGWGSTTQDVYLIIKEPSLTFGLSKLPWVIRKIGNDISASDGTFTSAVITSATEFPSFIDHTVIYAAPGVGVPYVVLQIRTVSPTTIPRTFWSAAIGGFTEITHADFNTKLHRGKMEHLDGYALILAADNLIWNSDLNSLTNWLATSFIAKQITLDSAVGLAKLGKQIIAFGDNTAEIFYNSGGTTGSPLSPLGHLSQRYGLIAPNPTIAGTGHYYARIGGRIYFVGRSAGGSAAASVFSYNGQTFEEVSNVYVDKILAEVVATSFYSVNAVGFAGQQAVAILLSSPNATSQRWLMFFPKWKEWFEWTSAIFSPINDGDTFLACSSGNKDKIYKFTNTDNWQDAGTSYPWFTQFKHPGRNARNFMHMYGVEADTDTVANDLTVEVSDDDTATFTTLGTIDLTQERKVMFRGGQFYRRHIRIGNTNARPCRIHNWLARLD